MRTWDMRGGRRTHTRTPRITKTHPPPDKRGVRALRCVAHRIIYRGAVVAAAGVRAQARFHRGRVVLCQLL